MEAVKISFGNGELLVYTFDTPNATKVVEKLLKKFFKAGLYDIKFHKEKLIEYFIKEGLKCLPIETETLNFHELEWDIRRKRNTPVRVENKSIIKEKISFAEFKRRANISAYGKGQSKKFIILYNNPEDGGFPYKYKLYPFKELNDFRSKEASTRRAYEILFEDQFEQDEMLDDPEISIGEFKIPISYR